MCLFVCVCVCVSMMSTAICIMLYGAVVACAVHSDITSGSLAVKSHGRVDVGLTLARAVLVLVFSLHSIFHGTVMIIATWAAAAVMLYTILLYRPYRSAGVNRAHAACAAVYVWACVCLSVMDVRNTPSVS